MWYDRKWSNMVLYDTIRYLSYSYIYACFGQDKTTSRSYDNIYYDTIE